MEHHRQDIMITEREFHKRWQQVDKL
jgi:hypothetical protein